MPRPRKELPSPSSVTPSIVRYARERGLDVALLVCRFQLPADVEQKDEVVGAPDDPHELFEWVARACGEPDVALRLGTALPMRRYGFAELAARASETLGRALRLLARYAPLLHVDFDAALDDGGGEARWILRTPRRPRGVGRHLNDFALAHTVAQCRASHAGFGVTRAWFAHARPRDLEPLHATFGTRDLEFGCVDSGLAFAKTWLDRSMPGVDGRMLATIEPLAEAALRSRVIDGSQRSLSTRLAARLSATLPDGVDVTIVASALHMSPRTLQRRLEEEGTAFTEVLDRVRLERARDALRDPATSLTALAFQLGFADLATFSRAFKRWTGQPPGQWREANRR